MAARYWVGGNATWDATAGTKWALTSGGAGGEAVPTAADDVFFDNADNITTASATCKTWTCTGYTGTFTLNGTIAVAGNVTLDSGMTITTSSGTPLLTITATSTITSNGKTWPYAILTSNNFVITLVGDFYVTGNFSINTGNTFTPTTAETLNLAGNFTHNGTVLGTAEIIMTGGTWAGSGSFRGKLTFNGNVTVSSAGSRAVDSTATIKFIAGSGTVTTTGSTLNIGSAGSSGSTFDTDGITWNNVTFSHNTGSTNFISNFQVSGTLTISVTHTLNTSTSSTITSSNGIVVNGACSGTAKIILTGGTWSGSNTTGIANDLDLQGNVTVSTNVYYRTGTLRYVSGTITVTSSTLNITGSCTLNTNGMSWNSLVLGAGAMTITLTSNCSVGGVLANSGAGVRTINRTTSETMTVANGISTSTGSMTGTAELILTGGTWTAGSTSATISNNFTIKGNVTMAATVAYATNLLKFDNTGGPYTVTTTGSTLYLYTNCTLDTNGITWATVTSPNLNTITINSSLNADTLFIGATAQTFAGTSGFNVATFFVSATSAITHTLKDGITYTITSLFDCKASRIGSIVLFTSSHASNRANIVMPNNGSNLCNVLASFTRINASGGRSLNTFGGTITDCVNVNQYYDYKPVAL